MSVKVTLTSPEGSKTITTKREWYDAIAYFRVVTAYNGESFRNVEITDRYAKLTRNFQGSVHTLEFELQTNKS